MTDERGGERRDLSPYIHLLESFKRDMYEHMDRGFAEVKTRITESHVENRQWQAGHAGPSSDSMHGQEGAKRRQHYKDHEEFRDRVFTPLVEKVNHSKWTMTTIVAALSAFFSGLWVWLMKWWPGP